MQFYRGLHLVWVPPLPGPQRSTTGGIPLQTPLWSAQGAAGACGYPAAPRHTAGVRGFGPGGLAAGQGRWPPAVRQQPGRARPMPAGTEGSSPGSRGGMARLHPSTGEPAFRRPSPPLPAERRLPGRGLPVEERGGTLPSSSGKQSRLRPQPNAFGGHRGGRAAGAAAKEPPPAGGRHGGARRWLSLEGGGPPFRGLPVSHSTGPQWQQDEGTGGPSEGQLVRSWMGSWHVSNGLWLFYGSPVRVSRR